MTAQIIMHVILGIYFGYLAISRESSQIAFFSIVGYTVAELTKCIPAFNLEPSPTAIPSFIFGEFLGTILYWFMDKKEGKEN